MPASAPADATLGERLQAVERLIGVFRLERVVYLAATIASLLMLLGSAAVLIYRTAADATTLTLLFGSSGLITYSGNRLLHMWDQALQVLQLEKTAKRGS